MNKQIIGEPGKTIRTEHIVYVLIHDHGTIPVCVSGVPVIYWDAADAEAAAPGYGARVEEVKVR